MERKARMATVSSVNPVEEKRKPYASPKLRRLGSVRDLTHAGGCKSMSDGILTMMHM